MAEKLLLKLRQINRWVAIAVGMLYFACAAIVLVDIILRQLGSSLGGTDEISGYVMAIGVAWGMAFALLELSHVRIDFLRSLTATKIRVVFDLVSMFIFAATVSIIAVQSWPVVAKSIKNGSTANTPLETPLAWVQVPWLAGWAWFAVMAWLVFIAAMALTMAGDFKKTESAIGVFPEHEAV